MQNVPKFIPSDSQNCLSVRISDTLRETLELFRKHRAMRILAVVDQFNKPVGVIREVDVRALLFNPYGHALMSNPGFGKDIHNLVKPCAVAEYDLSVAELIAAYSAQIDSPGLVLTTEGQFLEALSDDQLLELMAQGRIARAEKITTNSHLFTHEILSLSGQLCEAANKVHALSETLGDQAQAMTNAAQNVAAGASHSWLGLQDVNERGHMLADAMERLTLVASQAKLVRVRTSDVIDAADPHMDELAKSGTEIGKIIEVIYSIGRQTNFLALNAQIEAVRQDASNQGFVAVAGEIKQLANETKGAAVEVTKKVDGIGHAVNDVLAAHRDITDAMGEMSAISDKIDTAVGEHTATSQIIAAYVEQAADATSEIGARAQDIGTRALHVQNSAKDLEHVSAMLLKSAIDIRSCSQEFVQSIKHT